MSNLVGPGRVLGNLYSSLGRRLEIGASAHKAGFGPSTAYKKIQDCYETVWSDGHLVERKLSRLLQNSYFIHYRLSWPAYFLRKMCCKMFDFAIE